MIKDCTICANRFAATQTGHAPRPVVWFEPSARVLIAGQAPGARVHASGRPFTDPSGDRLRSWLGIDKATFYDRTLFAIMPMAFCFPGYDTKGADLPPPSVCAQTWREDALRMLSNIKLTIVIGGYAIAYHLGRKTPVTQAVRDKQAHQEGIFVLPHPSWRNTGWLKKNTWFENDILPLLKSRVAEVLDDR